MTTDKNSYNKIYGIDHNDTNKQGTYTQVVANDPSPLPDLRPHTVNELFTVIAFFAIISVMVGIASDILNIIAGKLTLPKHEDGVKTNKFMTFLMLIAKFIINGFVGMLIGVIGIYLLNIPVIFAVFLAGVGGGNGDLIYQKLSDRLNKKVNNAGDLL
jgi:hypothetical protein